VIYPLINKKYSTSRILDNFLTDLKKYKHKYILYDNYVGYKTPLLESVVSDVKVPLNGIHSAYYMSEIRNVINNNYRKLTEIGEYTIYVMD